MNAIFISYARAAPRCDLRFSNAPLSPSRLCHVTKPLLDGRDTSVKRGERRGPTIFLLRCLDDPLITAELITA